MVMNIRRNRFSDNKRELFYTELCALLTAGLDFSQAFRLLIDGEEGTQVKKILEQIFKNVVAGAALWQAMEHSGEFSRLEYGVVRIGNDTGKLTETLKFLGDYFHKRISQRRMISSAVSYPLIILGITIVVVMFMLTVVVPMFEEVYARMGNELPVLTRWIIMISSELPIHILWTLVVFGGVGLAYYVNRNSDNVRRWVSYVLLYLPIVSTIIRKNYEAQFCRLLYLLTSSGVPLLTSIETLSSVIGFYSYKKSFEDIAKGLERGSTFAKEISLFPDLYDIRLVALVRVGEETGRLPEMLHRRAETLVNELEYVIRRIGTLLEPLLILLVGILVAVILIAMYMPMFSLGGIMT